MDPTQSEQQKEIAGIHLRQLHEAMDREKNRLIEEMLLGDQRIRDWYMTLIQKKLEQQMLIGPVPAGIGYPTTAKASESEVIDMSAVIATVANIDPSSVCEEESCSQKGELYKDHRVSHTTKGTKKGQRGECPHCGGRLHNTNDAAQLIAFQCLWRQAFGEDAKKVAVTASTLYTVGSKISKGEITQWADRSLLHTVSTAVAAPPKGVTGTSAAGSTSAPASPSRNTPLTAPVTLSPSAVGVSTATTGTDPKGPAPTAGGSATPPSTAPTEAQREDKKRKLREALQGARVIP